VLRLYARMHVGEPANYKEIVASASDHDRSAAFHAAVKQYPQNRLTLRQGTRVILNTPTDEAVEMLYPPGVF
jgi:hypothetical protein